MLFRTLTPLLILILFLILLLAAQWGRPSHPPVIKKDAYTLFKETVFETARLISRNPEPIDPIPYLVETIELNQAFPTPSGTAPERIAREKDFAAKGVYINGSAAGSPKILEVADRLKEIGGNTIVFDIREVDGLVYFRTRNPLARSVGASKYATIQDLRKLIQSLHEKEIHTVARIVVFKDEILAKKRPDMAVQSVNGGPWIGGEGQSWLDPSHPMVQEYVLSLAEEVAQAGIDEIQFDYIRFPATTGIGETQYHFDPAILSKKQIITGFVRKAHDRLKPYNILLSADVFGVIAWDGKMDERILGQSLPEMAQYLDAISPMLYPSHFHDGYDGYAKPADSPDYFIRAGVEKSVAKMPPGGAVIRPWLQAFGWKTPTYGPDYITTQIRATEEAKGVGWLFWNAGSSYGPVWQSLVR